MSKHLTDEIELLSLSLEKIFPLKDSLPDGVDDGYVVNEAYKKLFAELIPEFTKGEVQFVLAEVLELERRYSRPRILIYSNQSRIEVEELLNRYFKLIDSLREDRQWSISKSDALYTGSRIWCAKTYSEQYLPKEKGKYEWVISERETLRRGYEFGDEVNNEKEEQEIEAAFKKYVEGLYSLLLKNYPFAYVMLIPVFLGSIYGTKESRKKLGAVFLHFTTINPVDTKDLLDIYGRTLLFWHYYFTSEAVDKRQRALEESIRVKESLELSVGLYKRIEPFVQQIRDGLQEMQKPLIALETEMNPVRGILFSGADLSRFFQAGRPIYIGEGLPEITPKHDWIDGDIETYKTLIAGVLVKVFRLEKEITAHGTLFWAQVVITICNKANELAVPLFKEVIKSIPHLCDREPNATQVKETFKIIKSWFNDAYKPEKATSGLPVTLLDFALRVWGGSVIKEDANIKTFWVASEFPVQTIDALGILHEKHRFQEAYLNVSKNRDNGKAITSCSMKITFGLSHGEVSNKKTGLEQLESSLRESLENKVMPRGDTTKFLWTLCGRRKLILNGTVFNWNEGNCEFSVDFMDTKGQAKEMLISWKGEINV